MTCGISHRFQWLFHSTGQVAHTLLTRPPLRWEEILPKLSFISSSFDLHVLSTPPAFILSQDQTLILKCLSPASFCYLANYSGFSKPANLSLAFVSVCLNWLWVVCYSYPLFSFQGSTLRCRSENYLIRYFLSRQVLFQVPFVFISLLSFQQLLYLIRRFSVGQVLFQVLSFPLPLLFQQRMIY